MTTDTAKRILGYIGSNKQAKVVDLVRDMGLSNVAIHKQLNKLMEQGKIQRVGKPPLVFYILKEEERVIDTAIPEHVKNYINENYVYVSPTGEFLEGMDGFVRWVVSTNQESNLQFLAQDYVHVREGANQLIKRNGWIDATQTKSQGTFSDDVLYRLLYKDFYSVEKFGKTKLGQMVLTAKISQNIKIIDKVIDEIKPVVQRILEEYNIDTIAYIPPSVPRDVQLMTELKNRLQLGLREIVLKKVYTGDVIVSQKSLSKLSERILNAQRTIFVDVNKSALLPKNVLIIDDAVGSGATIHETAKQVRDLINPQGYIMGFAIVGSIKGFEVIREI